MLVRARACTGPNTVAPREPAVVLPEHRIPFEEAVKVIQKLHIESKAAYAKLHAEGKLEGFPATPSAGENSYGDKWQGWDHFLSTGNTTASPTKTADPHLAVNAARPTISTVVERLTRLTKYRLVPKKIFGLHDWQHPLHSQRSSERTWAEISESVERGGEPTALFVHFFVFSPPFLSAFCPRSVRFSRRGAECHGQVIGRVRAPA